MGSGLIYSIIPRLPVSRCGAEGSAHSSTGGQGRACPAGSAAGKGRREGSTASSEVGASGAGHVGLELSLRR